MRYMVLVSVLLSASSFAQTPKVKLDLGPVTVWLGMSKSDVVKKFSAAGYDIKEMDSDGVSVPDGKRLTVMNKSPFPTKEAWQNVYFLSFAGGHLSYAERSWFDEKDPLSSVIEAVGSLTARGSSSCTVSYSPNSSPGASVSRVFIECGKRSLLLVRGEYEMEGSKNPLFEVSEFIGNQPQ